MLSKLSLLYVQINILTIKYLTQTHTSFIDIDWWICVKNDKRQQFPKDTLTKNQCRWVCMCVLIKCCYNMFQLKSNWNWTVAASNNKKFNKKEAFNRKKQKMK